jgi:hypothetical protein
MEHRTTSPVTNSILEAEEPSSIESSAMQVLSETAQEAKNSQ